MIRSMRFLVILFVLSPFVYAQDSYPFQNPAMPLEDRVSNILSLMTLEEKLACLETSSAVPRLGIPDAGGTEGLHGIVQAGNFGAKPIPTTSFPEVIGMASTWDPTLIHDIAAAEAYEARYITQSAKYKHPALVVWGPNADLARDPRWGRNNESYGEDPFFDGVMATAYSKGLQGDNPKYWQTASLLKHFFANSNETTRGGSSSNFDNALFWDYYSAPFRMAIQQGGAKSFMASYNAWNKVPMTVNPIIDEVVIKQWGANGIFSSDATAVEQMVTNHKYFADQPTALAAAIKAGISQVLSFGPPLAGRVQEALKAKLLTEGDIDNALRGKFRTVIWLGLLDPPAHNPYVAIGESGEPEPWTTDKHKDLSLNVAHKSIVLLKNANNTLPLNVATLKSIAVIGPRANDNPIDMYAGVSPYSITPIEGVRRKLRPQTILHHVDDNNMDLMIQAAKEAEVAVVVVGNHPICGGKLGIDMFNTDTSTKPCADKTEGREGRDRESIDLSQEDLIRKVYAVNPRTIVVLVSSFPYAIPWTQANIPAILQSAHTSQDEGTAIADVLFGDYNPGGRLNQTWPKSLEQLPPMDDYDIRHGRTYMYFKGDPLYPFGYGLSYTTFQYSNMKSSVASLSSEGTATISVDVKNTGTREGDEVVELYVAHLPATAGRPAQELKGFQRVTLKPGEIHTVTIPLKSASLAWWNDTTKKFEVDPGPLEVSVGSSSTDIRQKKTITIKP